MILKTLFLILAAALSAATTAPAAAAAAAAALDCVNGYRSLHRAPPVSWNATVYERSQAWADHIASNDRAEHSSAALSYGENIAVLRMTQVDDGAAIETACRLWYGESSVYDYRTPAFSPSTGHFTQLVWADTTQVGAGIASNGKNTYIVMQFEPPGNVDGLFSLNVFPPHPQAPPQFRLSAARHPQFRLPRALRPPTLPRRRRWWWSRRPSPPSSPPRTSTRSSVRP
jgi:uncharacterized protein YkwD